MTPLHSILLSERGAEESPWLRASLNSFRTAHPGAVLQIYRDESLRQFIVDHFDDAVVAAYDQSDPVVKSHLGRYCLLYQRGGVYSDPNLFFVTPAVSSDALTTPRLFRNADGGAPGVSIALISAPARMDVFERCIRNAVDASGRGAEATGSKLFASTIAACAGALAIQWGDVLPLPSRKGVDRRAYKSASGAFVAVSQKRNGAHVSPDIRAPADEENALMLLALLDGLL